MNEKSRYFSLDQKFQPNGVYGDSELLWDGLLIELTVQKTSGSLVLSQDLHA